MKFKEFINEIGFKSYPKGWDKSSVLKFVKTLSKTIGKDPDEKGWMTACIDKMKKEMGDGAPGFCAACLDTYKGHTKWRGKHKNENINEKFVDLKDVSTDEEILRLAIEAELDAINLYQVLSRKTRDEDLKNLLLDVAFEEKIHVKEFEALLEEIDPEYEDAEYDAEEELEDKGFM
jgi:hypothetical protein